MKKATPLNGQLNLSNQIMKVTTVTPQGKKSFIIPVKTKKNG
jgi:hypothetical protein